MVLRRVLTVLLVIGLMLPIAEMVLLGLGRLLGAMGDDGGAEVLDRLSLAGGVLWAIDLICLLLVVALGSLPPGDRHD